MHSVIRDVLVQGIKTFVSQAVGNYENNYSCYMQVHSSTQCWGPSMWLLELSIVANEFAWMIWAVLCTFLLETAYIRLVSNEIFVPSGAM